MWEQKANLEYTIEHFKEIARQNLFAENKTVPHDSGRCLICHPEVFLVDAFIIYLRVVTESVKVRRPRLDQGLVDEINGDLELMGESVRISRQALLEGDRKAVELWSGWVREALATGLALLSIHSTTSREFTLEGAEAQGYQHIIAARVNEIMDFQRENA